MITSVTGRVAENEALFAEANDRIAALAGTLGPRSYVPFLCECPAEDCTQIAELSLGEYAAMRLFANRFAVSPRCTSGEHSRTQILERNPRFTIVDRLL